MNSLLKSFVENEEGATAVEYGVLIALIIAACIVVIAALGSEVFYKTYSKVNSMIDNAT